ncbi:MAG: sensor histidine kinase [Myxococcota bacterium]
MNRVSFRTSLLVSFALVLSPVVVLLATTFRANLTREQQSTLHLQMLSAQAFALHIEQVFDAAEGLALAVAHDPLTHTMDPRLLDEHLRDLVRDHGGVDAVNVFDARGINRGYGNPDQAAEPRLDASQRDYFRVAMATNLPALSDVVTLMRPPVPGIVVSAPIRDAERRPVGVVHVVLHAARLTREYQAMRLSPGQAVLLMDRKGRLAFHTGAPLLTDEDARAMINLDLVHRALSGVATQGEAFTDPVTGEVHLGAFVPTPRHHWVVGVIMNRVVATAPLQALFRREVLVLLLLSLLSGGLALWLARRLSHPVRQLQSAALAVGRGAMGALRLRTRNRELLDLEQAFNQMQAQLEQRETQVREALTLREEFMVAAAHELKTPVTTIKTWARLLRAGTQSAERVQQGLQAVGRQAERIAMLADDLLLVARFKAGSAALEREELDLHEVLDEVVARATRGNGEQPVRVVAAPGALWVRGDRELLGRVIARLLENAISYSPSGAEVVAAAEKHGTDVTISVSDHGVGIHPERQQHVFEPFYEVVPAGERGYRSTVSMGLHASYQIIAAHGGRMGVVSTPGEGSTFWFRLPLAKEHVVGAGGDERRDNV